MNVSQGISASFAISLAFLGAVPNWAMSQNREVDGEATYELELPPPADRRVADEQSLLVGQPHLGIVPDRQAGRAVVVRSVIPRGPADQAGIEVGDTIEAINGERVQTYQEVLEIVDAMQPGDIVDIDFSRRIAGRTQAVVEGRARAEAEGESIHTSYDEPPANFRERNPMPPLRTERRQQPTQRASYEHLPAPAYANDKERRNLDSLDRDRRTIEFDRRRVEATTESELGREEPPRRGRLLEPRERRRALLPWRRN